MSNTLAGCTQTFALARIPVSTGKEREGVREKERERERGQRLGAGTAVLC